jgi:hypothetical protein
MRTRCWDSRGREGGGQGVSPPPRLGRACIGCSNASVHRVWVGEDPKVTWIAGLLGARKGWAGVSPSPRLGRACAGWSTDAVHRVGE